MSKRPESTPKKDGEGISACLVSPMEVDGRTMRERLLEIQQELHADLRSKVMSIGADV